MEDSWTIFKSKVKQAVSASTPFVKILEGKKIIEDTSSRSYQIKERSVEKFKDKRSETDWENYRKLKNKVQKMTREEIERQEIEISKASKSNPKLVWNYVKQKTKRPESVPNLTEEDRELTVSDQEKAEVLSQFFQLSLYA